MIDDYEVVHQLFDLYYELKERLEKIEKRVERIEIWLYGDDLF